MKNKVKPIQFFLLRVTFVLALVIILTAVTRIHSTNAAFPGANGKIAFAGTVAGVIQVFVMDPDGTNRIQLTYTPSHNNNPSWSANGTKIAFTSYRDGNPEIYVMNADGTIQTRLTNSGGGDDQAHWSADGSKIAFYSDRDGDGEIFVMNADGTNQTQLTNNLDSDVGPAWSPDGAKIAFEHNHEIHAMNADGTNQIPLANSSGDDDQPAWSPDGAMITFTSTRDGNSEIYAMNADGTNQTRLTNDPSFDVQPAWSPDGAKIAFMSGRDGNNEIYVMNTDGTNQSNITNTTANESDPNWQPINRPPTVNAGGPYQVNEGDSVQVSATGNDPEEGPLSYAWDMDNNGSFESTGQSVNFSAAALDGPSSYAIAVQVTDDGGLTATDPAIVNVNNLAPAVGTITAPSTPQEVNTVVNASASLTDAGILDTHTAVWDWGDNSISNGTVTESNGSGSVTGSHTYTSAGVYTLTLTVTDDDLGFDTNQFMYVTVYNPDGGFVTGAGRFDTPAGSIPSEPTRSGMTNFGTNAKYVNNVLTGSTRMNFRDGPYVFDFDSISYDWLVVTDGNLGRLHGSGTVNGIGGYTFELTALDNTPDTIRIQIWDLTNTEVYDNNTSVLTNGIIAVHN